MKQCFRVGHHSTSDDSSAYRNKKEVEDWNRRDNPVVRFRKYLEKKGWWNDQMEAETKKQARSEVLKAFHRAEQYKKPPITELFTDVYDKMTRQLEEQQQSMLHLVKKYPEAYPSLTQHAKDN